MTDTLTPPRQPSVDSSQKTTAARILTAKYGDGYKHDTPDGANPLERSWSLVWNPILESEVAMLEFFLETHVGTAFYYVMPREIAPRTVVWTQMQRTYRESVLDGFTVTLEERFLS